MLDIIANCASQAAFNPSGADNAARFAELVRACPVAEREVYVQPAGNGVAVSPATSVLETMVRLDGFSRQAVGELQDRHFKQRAIDSTDDGHDSEVSLAQMSEHVLQFQAEMVSLSLIGSAASAAQQGVRTLFTQQG